ncbi:MAG: hypothetical protein ARM1_0644 [Candidatus Micrarchaeota archaeon]|nr:MAG: hypothetical protein ARM1_0644 [Candidatus Micrarchaeota archaeon]
MKDRVIPEIGSFRYEFEESVADAKIEFEYEELDKEKVDKILESDIKRIFKSEPKNIEELMRNRFVEFEGDIKRLEEDLTKRDKLRFMLLLYIGKSGNPIETPFNNIDLSWLALLNRLNKFASFAEQITGKESRLVIAYENEFFDANVLRKPFDNSKRALDTTAKLIKEFNMNHIELLNLKGLLDNLEGFNEEFSRLVDEYRNNLESFKNTEEFKESYKTLYYDYNTSSFSEAVKLYASRSKSIEDWAVESTIRYLAFIKGRANTGFWNKYKDYVRSTVSKKNNVITFNYHFGGVTLVHGVTIYRRSIRLEYFYDIVKERLEKGRELKFKVGKLYDVNMYIH